MHVSKNRLKNALKIVDLIGIITIPILIKIITMTTSKLAIIKLPSENKKEKKTHCRNRNNI